MLQPVRGGTSSVQPSAFKMPPGCSQSRDVCMVLGGNMGHGHCHRPVLLQGHITTHSPQQHRMESHNDLSGSTGISYQAISHPHHPHVSSSSFLHRTQTTSPLLLSQVSTIYLLIIMEPTHLPTHVDWHVLGCLLFHASFLDLNYIFPSDFDLSCSFLCKASHSPSLSS